MTALASPYTDHPYADHLARVAAAPAHAAWRPEDGPLPSLYLGHGAPVLLEDRLWMRQLHDWARALPRPRAVLVVSAHWESAPLSISTTTVGAPLVHDHSGFDPAYRRLRYATPDASWRRASPPATRRGRRASAPCCPPAGARALHSAPLPAAAPPASRPGG